MTWFKVTCLVKACVLNFFCLWLLFLIWLLPRYTLELVVGLLEAPILITRSHHQKTIVVNDDEKIMSFVVGLELLISVMGGMTLKSQDHSL